MTVQQEDGEKGGIWRLIRGWVSSVFPASHSDAEAQELAETHTLIYWRRDCVFCIRLRIALGPLAGRAVWVNVSRDLAASARVRVVNDGNETVPTVFVQGTARTNPSPSWVRGTL